MAIFSYIQPFLTFTLYNFKFKKYPSFLNFEIRNNTLKDYCVPKVKFWNRIQKSKFYSRKTILQYKIFV